MDKWAMLWQHFQPHNQRVPPIAFIAHVDTSPAVTGKNVKPIIHKKYRGDDISFLKRAELLRLVENPTERYERIRLSSRQMDQLFLVQIIKQCCRNYGMQ